MTNLYIIRHGQAVCNVERRYGGERSCKGLTDFGRRQVARLERRLAAGEIVADVVYGSPLPRARETAEAVGRALGQEVRWERELQEMRPGEADGLAYLEADERFGKVYFSRPYVPSAPGAESWAAFLIRAGAALDQIVRKHAGQTIVVVAHGGVIDASFHYMFGLSAQTNSRAGVGYDHTSITHWRLYQPHHAEDSPRWLLMRHNDAAHLAGLEEETVDDGQRADENSSPL